MLSRVILVMALLLALVPLTAFADESSEYPITPLNADQARMVQAEQQIDGSSTQLDVTNATAIYEMQMGAAMARAEADVFNAQAIVKAHPDSATAQGQLASAQANYTQLLKLCGISLTAPTVGASTMLGPEAFEFAYDRQGGAAATYANTGP